MLQLFHEVFQVIDLHFLDFQQLFVLVHQEVVYFFAQQLDLQLGLQVDLVVMLRPFPVFFFCRFWLIMIMGACMAARQESIRFSRMNG